MGTFEVNIPELKVIFPLMKSIQIKQAKNPFQPIANGKKYEKNVLSNHFRTILIL
jgi:hypothetical protein